MLTDPSAPTNAMARCKGGYVPSEFQLGWCKPTRPQKKKSGFSLTPHVHRDFWARSACLLLWPLAIERGVQRNFQFQVRVINFPKTVHSGVPKDVLLNTPATRKGPLLPKWNNHQAHPKVGTGSIQLGIQPVLWDSYLADIILAYTPGLNVFIFSKIKTKTFSCCSILDFGRRLRTCENSFITKAYSHRKKQTNTPPQKKSLVNILEYFYGLFLQKRKKSYYNGNILIIDTLKSMSL